MHRQGRDRRTVCRSEAVGAGLHGRGRTFPTTFVRGHIERPYVPLIYDRFHFWNRIPLAPTFFPAAGKECRPRKGAPPRVSGLSCTPSQLTGRNSLPSVAQTRRPVFTLRRCPASPLRGRPPTERAGSCTIDGRASYIGYRLHFRCKRFPHTDAGLHRDACRPLHARGSFVSPLRGSLVLDVQPHAEADPHTIKNFLNHTQRLTLQKFLHIRRRLRRVNFRRSRTPLPLTLVRSTAEKVRLRTLLPPRTGIRLIPSPEPGPEAGQFQRGGFLICAALLLRRSQPERRNCARPLRKRAGAAPQSRSRRGGLSRLAVCTVPA